MRNFYLVLSLLLLSVAGLAQQRTQSSFNYVNKYNFQKSYAGLENCSKIFLQHKSQWVGVENAPTNTFLQAHTRLPWKFGVGLGINRWSAGLLDRFDASVAVAKHFQIKKLTLSPSVNFGYARYGLNPGDAVSFDNDSYLNQSRTASNTFYGDFGFLATYEALEVGVSIPSVFASNPEFDVADIDPTLTVERYFNAHASYDIQVKDAWRVTPMVFYRSIPANGQMIDAMAEVNYKENIGVAVGYRTNSGLLASANVNIKDMFTVGYAYDAGMQAIAAVGSGSHEVLLGFKLCRPEEETPEEEKNYFLRVTLVDGQTDEAVSGAGITLVDPVASMDTTGTSDTAGIYRFDVAPSRDYNVKVAHPDYEPLQVDVSTDSVMEVNVRTIRLAHKRAALLGTITDPETGEGIPGVKIFMPNGGVVRTNEKGEFAVKVSPSDDGAASQVFTATAPGYNDTSASFNVVDGNYDDINIALQMSRAENFAEENPTVEETETPTTGAGVVAAGTGSEASETPVPVEAQNYKDLKAYFKNEQVTLSGDARKVLDQVVKVMTENPQLKVQVSAHASCNGSSSYNQTVSDKRADNCAKYIKSRIKNPGRVSQIGNGERKPVSDCSCEDCSDEELAKNRRVEFLFSK
jgi:type IX secretion system PorP/SprF family membrane protein